MRFETPHTLLNRGFMTDDNNTRRLFRFPGEPPQRLDVFLAQSMPEHSRTQVQRWIKNGLVQVDGITTRKAGATLDHPQDVLVDIPAPEPSVLKPENIALDIVFENQDVLVVNKPAGMVVHPSAGHAQGTLVHAALAYVPDIEGVGGVRRPGVVHRLDKLTSGLIILAKNDVAHRFLQDQFRNRRVEKTYLALVDGAPPTPEGRIEAAIGRDSSRRKRMRVVPPGRGREAISDYATRRRFREYTLLEVRPHTGRTHQIRVHLAFIECPVVGDRVYGRKKNLLGLNRHFLHAFRLGLTIPGARAAQTFEASLPPELQEALSSAETR